MFLTNTVDTALAAAVLVSEVVPHVPVRSGRLRSLKFLLDVKGLFFDIKGGGLFASSPGLWQQNLWSLHLMNVHAARLSETC